MPTAAATIVVARLVVHLILQCPDVAPPRHLCIGWPLPATRVRRTDAVNASAPDAGPAPRLLIHPPPPRAMARQRGWRQRWSLAGNAHVLGVGDRRRGRRRARSAAPRSRPARRPVHAAAARDRRRAQQRRRQRRPDRLRFRWSRRASRGGRGVSTGERASADLAALALATKPDSPNSVNIFPVRSPDYSQVIRMYSEIPSESGLDGSKYLRLRVRGPGTET